MIQLPAILTGFSSRVDGSASVRFTTNELQPDDFAGLQQSQNAYGWLVFKENAISEEDIPKEDAEEPRKTPSKRLRSSLYVLWKQQGEPQEFETFYREKMEKFIEAVKNKLD